MWMPRVKIYLDMSHRLPTDKLNQWNQIREEKGKKLLYRYIKGNYIEFVLCFFHHKEEALREGKRLYFNVLFNGYKCNYLYAMGDDLYMPKDYNEKFDGSFNEYYSHEKYFFSTKKSYSNTVGLMIYQVDSLDDYDKFYKEINSPIWYCGFDESLMTLIKNMKNDHHECDYNEEIQQIFHLFYLAEHASTELSILLLCQILESFGTNEEKSKEITSLIERFEEQIKNSYIEQREKDSLLSSMKDLKRESNRKKIKKILNKYNPINYEDFDQYKVVQECYTMRSHVIHGEFSKISLNAYKYESFFKTIVLDTFYGWVKEKCHK